ncbi:U-box domain-containing protein 4-like [Pyrus ussuriensis x Pyrus communis]|uniref:U-box domain-containing protein 4-like n=1 Tax=Pyrus ussuriensis x Pyrus communis TaxID=2448454 RepID=A0A5N5I726_9ROSA|nr:U-box domain-containing protein 4-like [Pyrus ussuriensis x Pyrus communis]
MRLDELAICTHSSAKLEPCQGSLQRENFSTEIIESISVEYLQPTIKICVDGLQSSSLVVKQSAAAKLRLLTKNQVDNHALIGESGAFPALIPLLQCSNPWTHKHVVTAHTQFAKFQLGFEHGRKKRMDAQGKGVKGVATEHTQFAKFQLGFDLFE